MSDDPCRLVALDAEHVYVLTFVRDYPEGASHLEIGMWNGSEWAAIADQPTLDQHFVSLWGQFPGSLYGTTLLDGSLWNLRDCTP